MLQNNQVAPSSSSPTDSDSVHRRHVHSSIIPHRRLTVASVIQPDSLGAILPTDEITLKRHLGLFSGVCFIVGSVVGSGIFISPKGVLRETESVGFSLIVWTLSGLISLLGALCYAEIGTLIPRNGAEAAYMKEGIGSVHARTGELLGYLHIWTDTLILLPATISVLSLTFSQYFLSAIMDGCGPPEELIKLLAIFVILITITINSLSVSMANRVNIVFVICKVVTILIIIIAGLVRIGQGYTQNLQNSFAGTTKEALGVALAFYNGLYAYGGWTSLNSVTEELKNPRRNLWLSIVIALPFVVALYVLTNVSYFTAMTKAELLGSRAVAVTWGDVVLGSVAPALPVLISLSALGSTNAILFQAARHCMVGAQYGYLPEIFACIHRSRLTPLPGVIFQGLIAIIYCIPSDIYTIINFTSFSAWIFHGLAFVATLCCKFTKKDAERVISVPIPFIIFMILVAIYLVVIPVVSSPDLGYLIASLVILFGLVFYYPFVYRKIKLGFVGKINSFVEIFFKLQRAQVNI